MAIEENYAMAHIDQQAELDRAGANIEGRWDAILHFSKNYPLAVTGIFIVIIFIFSHSLEHGFWIILVIIRYLFIVTIES